MRTSIPFPILARIVLVCILFAVIGLRPHPLRVMRGFEEAAALERAGKPAEAATALRAVVEMQPWRSGLWERIAGLELDGGDYAGAVQAYAEAARLNNLSLAGKARRGDAYLLNDDAEQAALVWREALDASAAADGNLEALFERIYRAQRDAGELETALETANAWHAQQPANAWPQYQAGLLMIASQPDEALAVLLEAARADPDISPAVETLRKAVGLAGTSDSPAYQKLVLGRALGSLGEWELAEQLITESTELAPAYAEAWGFLGEAKQNLGKIGYPDLLYAEKLNPDSVVVQALLAVYWRRQDSPALALQALEKAIALEPEQSIWLIEAGNTQAEAGDLIRARAYFNKAIELEAGSAAAWEALARYTLDYSDDVAGTGLPAARRALLLAPRDAQALDLMGAVFLSLGDLVSAERFLQRAIEQDSTLALAHLHLGQVYLHQGNVEAAVIPLSTAERLSPESAVGGLARRLLAENAASQP